MAKGLGKGLSALIGDSLYTENNNELNYISLEEIIPNPDQPRKSFSDIELEELANSIKQNGVLQPILVDQKENNKYQIIAGERRWRAAKISGLEIIPAIVKNLSKKEKIAITLIENIQRENLTALEEAEGYKKLIDEHNYTQADIAALVSKSRSHIANLLRILSLPDKIKDYLNQGSISLGHAKLLVNQKNNEILADLIVSKSLNVRESENLINQQNISPLARKNSLIKGYGYKDEDILALEKSLSNLLEVNVKIDIFSDNGRIAMFFNNMEQLDQLVQKLTNNIA